MLLMLCEKLRGLKLYASNVIIEQEAEPETFGYLVKRETVFDVGIPIK